MKYLSKIAVFIIMIALVVALCAFSSETKKEQAVNPVINVKPEIKESSVVVDESVTLKLDVRDFKALGFSTGYTKIDDYLSFNKNEIKLTEMGFEASDNHLSIVDKSDKSQLKKIIEVKDGYILALSKNLNDDTELNCPLIKKVNFKGEEVWKYSVDKVDRYISIKNIYELSNGNIVFDFECYDPVLYHMSSIQAKEKSYLMCLNTQGKLLWSNSFDYEYESQIENIIVTENDELLCVGACESIKSSPKPTMVYTQRDIILTKIDTKGNIVKQRVFGGSKYETVHNVAYSKEFGLVIEGYTQSTDGDFIKRDSSHSNDYVARINSELNTVWVKTSNHSFYTTNVTVNGEYLYVSKSILAKTNKHKDDYGLVEKYNKYGDLRSSVKNNLFPKHLSKETVLLNGNFIIASKNEQACDLMIFDKNGIVIKKIALQHYPREIVPTNDGGFILKSVRNIKTLPQPLAISCVWYDTETLIEKYDKDYKLEWRKSYDKYKDIIGTDYVQPLPSGKVIVE